MLLNNSNGIVNISLTWDSPAYARLDHYFVGVSPQPLNRAENFTSTNTSISLSINSSSVYLINISLSTDMLNGVQFQIGMNLHDIKLICL